MLGIKLGELAETVGLSQTDIANHLGLNRAQVNRWARGVRPVPKRYRKALTDLVFQAAGRCVTELLNPPSCADAADPERGPRATALKRIRDLTLECVAAELEADTLGIARSLKIIIEEIATFTAMAPTALYQPATITKLKELGIALTQGALLIERLGLTPDFHENEKELHHAGHSQPDQPRTPGAANAGDQ